MRLLPTSLEARRHHHAAPQSAPAAPSRRRLARRRRGAGGWAVSFLPCPVREQVWSKSGRPLWQGPGWQQTPSWVARRPRHGGSPTTKPRGPQGRRRCHRRPQRSPRLRSAFSLMRMRRQPRGGAAGHGTTRTLHTSRLPGGFSFTTTGSPYCLPTALCRSTRTVRTRAACGGPACQGGAMDKDGHAAS